MGYRVYSFGRKGHEGSEAEAFFRAAETARAAVEDMHNLACEMEDRYGERFYGMRNDGYGMRGDGYGMRGDGYGARGPYPMEPYPMMPGYGMREDGYGDRRMRDSMGRFR